MVRGRPWAQSCLSQEHLRLDGDRAVDEVAEPLAHAAQGDNLLRMEETSDHVEELFRVEDAVAATQAVEALMDGQFRVERPVVAVVLSWSHLRVLCCRSGAKSLRAAQRQTRLLAVHGAPMITLYRAEREHSVATVEGVSCEATQVDVVWSFTTRGLEECAAMLSVA